MVLGNFTRYLTLTSNSNHQKGVRSGQLYLPSFIIPKKLEMDEGSSFYIQTFTLLLPKIFICLVRIKFLSCLQLQSHLLSRLVFQSSENYSEIIRRITRCCSPFALDIFSFVPLIVKIADSVTTK